MPFCGYSFLIVNICSVYHNFSTPWNETRNKYYSINGGNKWQITENNKSNRLLPPDMASRRSISDINMWIRNLFSHNES